MRSASFKTLSDSLEETSKGQHLIGSSQPITATVGADVILPCLFNPARDVTGLTLEWTRPDLDPDLRFVFVWRSNEELSEIKNPSYKGRTVLFTEELKNGNISLKLTKVRASDDGTFRCFVPTTGINTSVQLNVAASSSALVSVAGVDGWRGAVVLQCESGGWYPEPELSWLDSEGRPLSADPPQTLRRPDGLYNISSRTIVEQSSTFTCRVSESSSNQSSLSSTRLSDDIFRVNFSRVIITFAAGFAAALFFVISVVLLILLIWKTRQNKLTMNSDDQRQISQELKDDLNTEVERLKRENKALGMNLGKVNQLQEKRRRREIAENTSNVLVDKVDPWGRYVTLRNKSEEQKQQMKNWEILIEVDERKPLIYTFETDFTLRAGNTVTVWAKGNGPTVFDRNDKEWENQDPWNTGQTAVVSLNDNNHELMDRVYQEMHRDVRGERGVVLVL